MVPSAWNEVEERRGEERRGKKKSEIVKIGEEVDIKRQTGIFEFLYKIEITCFFNFSLHTSSSLIDCFKIA